LQWVDDLGLDNLRFRRTLVGLKFSLQWANSTGREVSDAPLWG